MHNFPEFVAFDVETTGTDPVRDAIVEIAAVRFKHSELCDAFGSLINPEREIPTAASRVHGIDDSMVRDQPAIDGVLEEFASFCGSAILVAHNAPFDFAFLKRAIEKYEMPAPSGMILDTLSMARQAITPRLPRYGLGSLVGYFKIPSTTFHRAEADAAYCGTLFVRLLELIAGDETMPPLENLINLSGGALYFPQIKAKAAQLSLF